MKKGFSLMELSIAIVVISVLASVALPQYQKAMEKSRISEAISILHYMHNQGTVCELTNGVGGCNERGNREVGIELSKGFTCHKSDWDEKCCDGNWCFINNTFDAGSFDISGSPKYPMAFRTRGLPSDVGAASPFDSDYTLEYVSGNSSGLGMDEIFCIDQLVAGSCQKYFGVESFNPIEG